MRFEFKKVGGSYRQEFLTDINGEIDLSKLEPGAYEVRELAGPEGYLMDDSVRIVQINPDEDANFVFTNTPKPSLVIVKYDPNTGKYLPGATFRIARVEDGSRYLDRVTGTDGRIVLHDLEPGCSPSRNWKPRLDTFATIQSIMWSFCWQRVSTGGKQRSQT